MPPPRICRKNGIRWVVSGDGITPMQPVDPVVEAKAIAKEEQREEKREEKQKDKLRDTIAESMEKLYLSLKEIKRR